MTLYKRFAVCVVAAAAYFISLYKFLVIII